MSHIRVLICRVDDPRSETVSELASFDLPAPDVTALPPETALDQVEATTLTTGTAILQRVLQAEWELVDTELAARYRQAFPPVAADMGLSGSALVPVSCSIRLRCPVCMLAPAHHVAHVSAGQPAILTAHPNVCNLHLARNGHGGRIWTVLQCANATRRSNRSLLCSSVPGSSR